jgi:hypothetical protein
MLCIIPDNSEFRTKLIIAARGRRPAPKEDKCGRTLSEMAYLLFEFSRNHFTGSGLSTSDGARTVRIGLYESKSTAFGGVVACVAENWLKSTNANVARAIKTAVLQNGIL